MEDLSMFDKMTIQSRLKNYDVSFVSDAATHMAEHLDKTSSILIFDSHVFDLYKDDFSPLLSHFRYMKIDCSEGSKTMDYSQQVIRELLKLNVRKNDILVAIGGGITQDIVAFISSIIFRGVKWTFYPTTLLAQADSCIGSKSSINFDSYKNLIGTFTPPDNIFISLQFLETLSESDIRSGIGEMLHYFLNDGIEDATELMTQYHTILINRNALSPFIKKSLSIKKKIIEIDEFDTKIRHIFNYGHTFGHAIEAISNYAIPHGQAITLGMDLANYLSLNRNMIDQSCFNEMHELLIINMPSFWIDENNIEEYCQALSRDKKNIGNKLGCILTRGAGKMEKCFLDIDHYFRNEMLNYFIQYHQS